MVVDEHGDAHRQADRREIEHLAILVVPLHNHLVEIEVGHRLAVRVDDADEKRLVLGERHLARAPGFAKDDEGEHQRRADERSKRRK